MAPSCLWWASTVGGMTCQCSGQYFLRSLVLWMVKQLWMLDIVARTTKCMRPLWMMLVRRYLIGPNLHSFEVKEERVNFQPHVIAQTHRYKSVVTIDGLNFLDLINYVPAKTYLASMVSAYNLPVAKGAFPTPNWGGLTCTQLPSLPTLTPTSMLCLMTACAKMCRGSVAMFWRLCGSHSAAPSTPTTMCVPAKMLFNVWLGRRYTGRCTLTSSMISVAPSTVQRSWQKVPSLSTSELRLNG